MQLSKDNFYLYAAKYYDNPQCLSEDEFKTDLGLIISIKKMLTRLSNDGVNVKLTMNMIITFYNVFESEAGSKLLSFRLNDQEKTILNSFLMYLSLPITDINTVDGSITKLIREEYQ